MGRDEEVMRAGSRQRGKKGVGMGRSIDLRPIRYQTLVVFTEILIYNIV